MWRNGHFHIGLVILIALAAFFLIRMRGAGGAETGVSDGRRLAQAWCESCHIIGPHVLEMQAEPPSFQTVANQPGITALALKVFLRTSHQEMPNLIISPDQAEALANYILSLKAN